MAAKIYFYGVSGVSFIPAELIKKKKLGLEHSDEEIRWIIHAYTAGELPDYQMSAWAMAVWFKGMTASEIATFTTAMRDSGTKFDFSHLKKPRVDKHSTGGVGDKTSLIVGPIVAAAGVHIPMISGRALGHTGGTLDKLESIPRFRINLSREEFQKYVEENYFALMGQTEDICPADKKFYSLRDVTSTVDSLPLICGSIMSKKLAEDLTGLVLDIKFGSGAFMKTVPEALALATLLKSTGEKAGLRVTALITNMEEPLGRFIGNSVEVQECLDILEGKHCIEHDIDFYENTRRLSLQLSAHLLLMANKSTTFEGALRLAEELLASGAARKSFSELILRQGPGDLSNLPIAKFSRLIKSSQNGYLQKINTEQVGLSGIKLGAGRKTTADIIDDSAGIETHCRLGLKISTGQTLFRIFANKDDTFDESEQMLQSAVEIGNTPPRELLPLVVKVLT